MSRTVDLRSDTVTLPGPEMREAMAHAAVGDDVFGEDPTMNELQEYCAELFGKEAALYVPSGTMANQTSLNAHTQPGDEIICEYGSHIFNYECGGPALLSGVQLHPLRGERGVLSADQVEAAIRPANVHHPVTRVVALENTHNTAGGVIYPLGTIREISELAGNRGLRMHLDGARLMNAVVKTGISPGEYARSFDSVTMCFSKGLGAPVGSVVAGNADFIARVHRYRKVYGGGMRQAGIIAAGALYALRHNVERLAEDHAHAQLLAQGLAEISGIELDPSLVETNIVMFTVPSERLTAQNLSEQLKERGVLMLPVSDSRIRAVTNLMVDEQDIRYALEQFETVLA